MVYSKNEVISLQSIEETIHHARKWILEAGDLQRKRFGKSGLKVSTKSSQADLVTELDRLSEEIILSGIREHYPDHQVMSEEFGERQSDSDYLWVVDPLDGTTNYSQGIPIFAISVALRFREETLLGWVYLPVLDELYEVVKGQGAFLNGEQLKVSEKKKLSDCVLATGFPYDKAMVEENNAEYFAHLVSRVRGLRRMGAAAWDLAYVAAGKFDGFWELALQPWDVEAGTLLVREAGGEVVLLPEKREVSLVAGNPAITRQILDELKEVDEKRSR